MPKHYIFGAGGFAQEVYLLARDCQIYPEWFVDLESNEDYTISEDKFFKEHIPNNLFYWNGRKDTSHVKCFLAVGDSKLREKMFHTICKRLNLKEDWQLEAVFPRLIHPSAKVMGLKDYLDGPLAAKVGIGTIITANVVVTTNVKIGNFCNLNLSSDLGHSVVLKNFVTLSPGARISGDCEIEDHVFFGTNSCTVEKVKIASGNIFGAGAVVTKSIAEEGGTWVGVPAKKIK